MDSWIYGFTETRRGEAAAERYGTSIIGNSAEKESQAFGIYGFLVFWFFGFMVLWFFGFMDLWGHASWFQGLWTH